MSPDFPADTDSRERLAICEAELQRANEDCAEKQDAIEKFRRLQADLAACNAACDSAERQRQTAVDAFRAMQDERDKALADLAAMTERANEAESLIHDAETSAGYACAEADRYRNILLTICHELELPRCDDGPCDEAGKYTAEIQGLRDTDLAREVANERDAARADVARLTREIAVERERRVDAERLAQELTLAACAAQADRDSLAGALREVERLDPERGIGRADGPHRGNPGPPRGGG